jgi:hypothetical protein
LGLSLSFSFTCHDQFIRGSKRSEPRTLTFDACRMKAEHRFPACCQTSPLPPVIRAFAV